MNDRLNIGSGIYIEDSSDGSRFALNADTVFEGSSVIKVAIVFLVAKKVKHDRISLNKKLPVFQRHLSIGSGIINWVDERSFTILEYINYIGAYSDCVASNVLLEFIGGKDKLNLELQKLKLSTRLYMDPLVFTDREKTMPAVSKTTPKEITYIFSIMIDLLKSLRYPDKLLKSFNYVENSWVQNNLDLKKLGPYKLLVKTGSMVGIGPHYDTVLNIVGQVVLPSKILAFSSLNRLSFNAYKGDKDILNAQKTIIHHLKENILLALNQ